MTVTALERRRIPLGRAGRSPFPSRFLVVAYAEGLYQVAYYRLRTPVDRPDNYVPADAWRLGVELGWFSEHERPGGWVRKAAANRNLATAIRWALEKVAPDYDDPVGIEQYIRSTAWGAELP